VCFQNVGEASCSVQVHCPSSAHFSLRSVHRGARLAPGMHSGFDFVFSAIDLSTADDFEADLCIRHDSGTEVIPVLCYAPKADCVLEGDLDFSVITSGTEATRQIQIVNKGCRSGEWSASSEGSLPLQLVPSKGFLEPGQTQEVIVTMQDVGTGQFMGTVVLTTSGQPSPKRYTASVQAVGAAFQIVGHSGQTMLEVGASDPVLEWFITAGPNIPLASCGAGRLWVCTQP
jgi:hypothetical protein